jgi:hypothetical protein
VASCWNAWYHGVTLSKIIPRDPRLPIRIEGTNFKGREAFPEEF